MKRVTYSRAAQKTLARLPVDTSRLIKSKIEQHAASPVELANNVKALKGDPGYFRLRVGDWRVVFREDGAVIEIIKIAPRGAIYE